MLLAALVGSGIMGERLAGGNGAIALLANALATGSVLFAVITAFGPISGAHFNPVVTLADAWLGGVSWRDVAPYIASQTIGACAGVMLANLMFGLPPVLISQHVRAGASAGLSEFIATFGLLSLIWACVRARSAYTAFVVAAYIVGAYWFTASTSFANPAVTLARTLSDTFAGIRPADAPLFIVMQVLGAASATVLLRWLIPMTAPGTADLTVPHENGEPGPRVSAAGNTARGV